MRTRFVGLIPGRREPRLRDCPEAETSVEGGTGLTRLREDAPPTSWSPVRRGWCIKRAKGRSGLDSLRPWNWRRSSTPWAPQSLPGPPEPNILGSHYPATAWLAPLARLARARIPKAPPGGATSAGLSPRCHLISRTQGQFQPRRRTSVSWGWGRRPIQLDVRPPLPR
jgi:hypothetical protein